MSIFEILMLVSFGSAWPFSIYRSYISRSVQGKSLMFMVILLFGYLSGMLHKYFYNMDNVIYLYMLNFTLVFMDIMLYLRNQKLQESLYK